jgi:hypothetical protein
MIALKIDPVTVDDEGFPIAGMPHKMAEIGKFTRWENRIRNLPSELLRLSNTYAYMAFLQSHGEQPGIGLNAFVGKELRKHAVHIVEGIHHGAMIV